jgi:putative tryptophan/tyrosine transport system substrate-binding protein
MRLRTIGLIVILALGLLVGLLSAEAQQAEEVYRIGYLGTRDGIEAREEAFRKGLRELGYIEGQNIVIEWRFSNRMSERLRKFAAELVRLKVDVIVSRSTLSTRAAKQATSTIPIVMVNVGDPVGRGLITSFAQPGGNVTGSTTQNTYIAGKRLELLKEAFPQVSRVAVLSDPKRPGHEVRFKRMEVAARALGVQLQSVAVRRPYDFEGAFRAATKEPNDALVIVTSGLSRSKARIVGLAAKSGLPTTYTDRRFVCWWSHELPSRSSRAVSPCCDLRGQDSERDQAQRSAR